MLHDLWIHTAGIKGKKANLSGADLTGTILEKKETVSPSFDEELFKLLDKYDMKLVGTILPK